MIRARIPIVLSTSLVLCVLAVACHSHVRVRDKGDVGPATKDTAGLVASATDSSVVALFRDTAGASVLNPAGRTFKLQIPAQRQSLHAMLSKERALWQAGKPRDYEFLLRVGCFCPGNRGWLLVEVRNGKATRAWDRTGRSVALSDWDTFSIDRLYDGLEQSAETRSEVRIAFDPRWHFPAYVHTVVLPGPDNWSTIAVRWLRPL